MPPSQPALDEDTLSSSTRKHISRMLNSLPESLKDAGRETVVQIVCDELRKMPVPILGSILAKAVEKQFGGEKATDESVYELGEMLRSMQDSDEGLRRELENINIFLPEVMNAINSLEQLMQEENTPDLRVLSSAPDLKYPLGDNELRIILSNTGGSSVMVDEILLEVEKWEPEATVDFSMPAAPMQMLFLKAQLSVEQREYPLLQINGVPPRIFGERGSDAEVVVIQLSSLHNARYGLRLKISWQDLSTGKKDVLFHPAGTEPPMIFPFTYAPGWKQDILPEKILEHEKVFLLMDLKFRKVLAILEEVYAGKEENIQQANEQLLSIGLNAGIMSMPGIDSMLDTFGTAFVSLAPDDNKKDAKNLLQEIRSRMPGNSV
ncbi:MAG: hypothetical protein JW705_09045 [Methanosarcinaceae archaeon]|nr:hypothetical protein [Methanosarcinaceae archaeon]